MEEGIETAEGIAEKVAKVKKPKGKTVKEAAAKINGGVPALPPEDDGTLFLPGTTRTSLTLADDASFDQWLAYGRILKTTEQGIHWWLGDLGNIAMQRGKEFAEQAVQAFHDLGFADSTIQNDISICSFYKPSERRDDLSFNHHKEAAYVQPKKKREEMIALAALDNPKWTIAQLRDAVREHQAKKVQRNGKVEETAAAANHVEKQEPSTDNGKKTKAKDAPREADNVAKADSPFPVTAEDFEVELVPLARRTQEAMNDAIAYLEQPTREKITQMNEKMSMVRDMAIQVMELLESYGAEAL